jgi:hypothetical protein
MYDKVAHRHRGLSTQIDGVTKRQEVSQADATTTQVVELLAQDVLHRDERHAVVDADVVDVDDVGMVEQRADARFVEKHVDDALFAAQLGLEPFDGDILIEALHRELAGQVDLGHATDRQLAEQIVATGERRRAALGFGAHEAASRPSARRLTAI